MKKLFRKLGILVVTWYANRLYTKAVEKAKKRFKDERHTIYVTSNLLNPMELITCNRNQYREMKRMSGVDRQSKGLVMPISELKQYGSWYHTGMDHKERELRRLAFVKMLLKRSKFVE